MPQSQAEEYIFEEHSSGSTQATTSMGKFYDAIPTSLLPWLRAQPIFFVATAPLEGGTVNTSPKASLQDGLQLIQVCNEHRLCYMDLTGSGNETISHLRQEGNGRITIMWVNLTKGPPRIVRIFGKGESHGLRQLFKVSDASTAFKGTVHERMDPDSVFHRLAPPQDRIPPGVRALIDIELHTCHTSCGYSIPIYSPSRPRRVLAEWTEKRVAEPAEEKDRDLVSNSLGSYWIKTNTWSVDGLPGLKSYQERVDPLEMERLSKQRKEHDAMPLPTSKSVDERSVAQGWTVHATDTSLKPSPTTLQPILLQIAAISFAAGCIATMIVCRYLQ